MAPISTDEFEITNQERLRILLISSKQLRGYYYFMNGIGILMVIISIVSASNFSNPNRVLLQSIAFVIGYNVVVWGMLLLIILATRSRKDKRFRSVVINENLILIYPQNGKVKEFSYSNFTKAKKNKTMWLLYINKYIAIPIAIRAFKSHEEMNIFEKILIEKRLL
jgi:hypothetical protein